MTDILETIRHSELLQIDASGDVVFETAPEDVADKISKFFNSKSAKGDQSFSQPDSDDSGDSLFLTQSVTPAHRRTKRHQLPKSQGLPFDLGSASESERVSDEDDVLHITDKLDVLSSREGSDENAENGVSTRAPNGSPVKKAAGDGKRYRTRPPPPRPRRMTTPFVKKKRQQHLNAHKTQVLVHSEMGGFFKCLKKICTGGEDRRKELDPALFPTVLEEDMTEEDDLSDFRDDQDDVRVVDMGCFILQANKRNKQPWLTKWKEKVSKSPRKPSREKDKPDLEKEKKKTRLKKGKVKTKRKKKQRTPKKAGALNESREPAEAARNPETSENDGNIKANQSNGFEIATLPSRPESPVLKNSLFSEEEERRETQLEVLATCTQSLDLLHGTTFLGRGEKSLAANHDDEENHLSVIEETQRPKPREETDESLTPDILVDRLDERNCGDDQQCSAKVSLRDHWTSALEEEGGSDIGSQDLFLQPESPSYVSPPSPSILSQGENISIATQKVTDEIPEAENGTQTESNEFSSCDLASAKTEDLLESYEEGDVATPEKQSEAVGFREGNDSERLQEADGESRPSMDAETSPIKPVASEEKAEISFQSEDIQLFNCEGLNLLKRKKSRRNQLPLVLQPASGRSDPTMERESTVWSENLAENLKDVRSRASEKPVDKFLDNGVSAETCSSQDRVLDSEAPCHEDTGKVQAKKQKKRNMNVMSEPQDNQGACGEETVPKPSPVSEGLVMVDDGLDQGGFLNSSHNHQAVTAEKCVQLDGSEPPRRTKKKARKGDLTDTDDHVTITARCDEERGPGFGTPETVPSKKKSKKSIVERVDREKQNLEANVEKEASLGLDEGELIPQENRERRNEVEQRDLEAQVENNSSLVLQEDELISQKKKKTKRRKEVVQERELEANMEKDSSLVLQEDKLISQKKTKRRKEVVEEQDLEANEENRSNHVLQDDEQILQKKKRRKEVVEERDLKANMENDSSLVLQEDKLISQKKPKRRKEVVKEQDLEANEENHSNVQQEDEQILQKKRRKEVVEEQDLKANMENDSKLVLQEGELISQKKKKTKKRKEVVQEQDLEAHVENNSSLGLQEDELILQKKKMKRKKEVVQEKDLKANMENDSSLVLQEDELISQKKKKTKKRNEVVQEQDLESHLENNSSLGLQENELILQKKMKRKKEVVQEQDLQAHMENDSSLVLQENELISQKKTTTKKRKEVVQERDLKANTENDSSLVLQENELIPQKKTKRRKEVVQEQDLESHLENNSSLGLQKDELILQKKKKTKRRKDVGEERDLEANMENNSSQQKDQVVTQKKKKTARTKAVQEQGDALEATEVDLEKDVTKKRSCELEAAREETESVVVFNARQEDKEATKKKKKKRRVEVVQEQEDEVERDAENVQAVWDCAEVDLDEKVRKKKKKRSESRHPEARQEEDLGPASAKLSISDGFEDQPRFGPSNLMTKTHLRFDSSEAGHRPHDLLEVTSQKKKKKKKRKEVESEPSTLASDNINHEYDKVDPKTRTSFMEDAEGERQDELHSDLTATVQNESNRLEDELVPRKKKKKKKTREEAEEQDIDTIKAVPNPGLEATEVVFEKKKRSKSRHREMMQEEEERETPFPTNGRGNPPKTDPPNPQMEAEVRQEVAFCSPAFDELTLSRRGKVRKRKKLKKSFMVMLGLE